MKTLAPELSALITIFASAGPVSSTRRSSRSGGADATVHSASRSSRVSAGNSGRSPAAKRASRSSRAPAARAGGRRSGSRARRRGRAPRGRAARPGRGPPARRPRRSCRPPAARAVRERLERRGATREQRRAVRRRGCARQAPGRGAGVRRAARGRRTTPRSAAVLPYQPGGQTRTPSAPLALDRVAADHDVAEHERAEAGQGIGRLSDRVAERDRARAVGHDAVVCTVAGDHRVGPAPVPVHRHDARRPGGARRSTSRSSARHRRAASPASAGTTGSISRIAPGSSQ